MNTTPVEANTTQGPPPGRVVLDPANPAEGSLRPSEGHTYTLELDEGTYVQLLIEPRRTDLSLSITGPEGGALVEVPRIRVARQRRRVVIVTRARGIHLIDLRFAGKTQPEGRFRLTVEALRDATPRDDIIVRGQQAFIEGERLEEEGRADSLAHALAKYQQARELWRTASHPEGEGQALHHVAEMHRRLGDNRAALERFREALPLVEAAGDAHWEASTLNGLGAVAVAMGSSLDALEWFRAALPAARRAGDRLAEATVLHSISQALTLLYRFDEAIEGLGGALALYRELGSRHSEALALSSFGGLYEKLGSYERAEAYLRQALPLIAAVGDRQWEATTRTNLGYALARQGRLDEARDAYSEALAIARAIGSRRSQATALRNLADVAARLGHPDHAGAQYEEALALARSIGDRRAEASINLGLGQVRRRMGDRTTAENYLEHALSLGRAILDLDIEARALSYLAGLQAEGGRLDEARAKSRAALDIIETLRHRIATPDERATFLASARQLFENDVQLLMRAHRADPSGSHNRAALAVSERMRARTLIDRLSETPAASPHLDATLLQQGRALRERLSTRAAAAMRLTSGKAPPEQVDALRRELDTLTADHARLEAEMLARAPRPAAVMLPATLSVSEIQQRALDPESTLIEFMLGTERSSAWIVTRESVTSFELPGRDIIERAASELQLLLTAPARIVNGETAAQRRARINQAERTFPAAASTLSAMLLGQAAPSLSTKRLIIVPDGVLHGIPFAALPDPTSTSSTNSVSGPSPLVVRFEIVTLPSLSMVEALRRNSRPHTSWTTAISIVADPVFEADDLRIKSDRMRTNAPVTNRSTARPDEGVVDFMRRIFGSNGSIPRLPFTRLEAERIAAAVGDRRVHAALDFRASRAVLSSADFIEARVLHFATHAFLDDRHPELSGLVLSLVNEHGQPQNGFLRLIDIYGLRLRTDLVVLSGCQTASGAQMSGEGLIGLTRAFLYAGASRIVASLWQIDDAATAELMKRFYQAMFREGMAPAAALREAQLALLKQRGLSSPFYWAAFVMQGEWRDASPTAVN